MKTFFRIVMILQAAYFISIPILSYNGISFDNSFALRLVSVFSMILLAILVFVIMREKDVKERSVITMCLILNVMWLTMY